MTKEKKSIDEKCEEAKRIIDKQPKYSGPKWDRSDAAKYPIAGKMAKRVINGDR